MWQRYLAWVQDRQSPGWLSICQNARKAIGRGPEGLTWQDLDAWSNNGSDLAPSSRWLYLSAYSSFYQWAIDSGEGSENPVGLIPKNRRIKKGPPDPHPLPWPEVERLLDGSDPESSEGILIHVLALTGLRVSEALDLDRGDIDFGRNEIHVRHGKGDKPRTVPINDRLKDALLAYLGDRNGDPGVFDHHGKPSSDRAWAQRAIARVAKTAGVGYCTPHTLRHSFASKLVNDGVNLKVVADILGHANIQTTVSYYVRTSSEAKAKAVKALA